MKLKDYFTTAALAVFLLILNTSFAQTRNESNLWCSEVFGKYKINQELEDRRSANEKHFQREDGQVDMLVSSEPINYFESGKWNTIYNTISEESEGQYKFSNYHNVFKSYYSENIQDGFKTLINNQEIFEMRNASMYYEMNGEKVGQRSISASHGKAIQNALTYSGVYGSSVDLQITQSGGKRKLDYIIKDKNVFDSQFSNAEYLIFSEEIVLPLGWSAKLDNGTVLIIDQTGRVVSLYDTPLVFDSNQIMTKPQVDNPNFVLSNYSGEQITQNNNENITDDNILYEIQLNGNKLVILTKVMMSYLLDENRVYPVVVDPTLTATAAVTGLYQTNGTTGAGNINSTGAPANSSITNTNISISDNSLQYRYGCGFLGLSTCWQSYTGNCGLWHGYRLTDVSSGKLINSCGGNSNYFNCSNPNRTWRMDIYSVDGYVYRGNFGYTLTITYETLAPDITPGTTNVCVGFDPPAITPTGLGVTNMASIGLYDSYGDGWNNGNVSISVGGTPVYTNFTLPNGFGPLFLNFPATIGQNVSVTYTAGSWCGENTYRLYRGGEGTSTLFFTSGTCPTGTYSTTAFGTIGNQYQWNLNGVPIGGATGASYDPPVLSVPGTYSYTVTVTDACGLTVTSAARVYTVNPQNTIAVGQNRTVCQGSAMTTISLATTGATGATVTGLPAGVTGTWAGNVVTISGTPTASGTFNYTVTTTGGCPPATTTGTITVNPINTVSAGQDRTVCQGSAMTTISLATTGATGATVTGLPAGVTGTWAGNVVTISGTPTASGTFNYTVTTTGGCPPATTTGTITVNPINTVAAGQDRTVCQGSAMTTISLATTGATGATVTGLPAGVTGTWAGNVVTISGTPTASGTFNYTVTTTGGCPPATTTGTITVNPINTVAAGQNRTVCQGSAMTTISLATTGATGATVTGLPAGVTGTWAGNVVTISGTPTASGTFNYTVTTTGGCPPATTTGTITVNSESTPITTITNPGTICPNTNTLLSASGGVAGSGSSVNWYTGPNGTGSLVGTGPIVTVAPSANTTYYVRREGTCNTTADASVTINVKNYVYAATGTTSNTYCTDNAGWHHFYSGDEIIFSVQGDLSAAPAGFPIASIVDNGTFYQQTQGPGTAPGCSSNQQPGEERFEMERSWNVDMGGGAPIGTYNIRFYYQPAERTAIEAAAANWMAIYPNCGYTYKYNPGANGFFWFKNSGSNYVAPMYESTQYSATVASTSNGVNYAQWTGISGFSGGSGAVILIPNSVLPVELTSFVALCNATNDEVSVRWTTATEHNSSHFNVERSVDGFNWNTLTSVDAAGNSTTTQVYEVKDYDVRNYETIYYRLQQFDQDGLSKQYGPVSVSCSDDSNDWMVFPNPASNEVTILLKGQYDVSTQINITDINGKEIQTISYDQQQGQLITVDLRSYAPGVYVVRLMTSDSKVQMVRLIKQ